MFSSYSYKGAEWSYLHYPSSWLYTLGVTFVLILLSQIKIMYCKNIFWSWIEISCVRKRSCYQWLFVSLQPRAVDKRCRCETFLNKMPESERCYDTRLKSTDRRSAPQGADCWIVAALTCHHNTIYDSVKRGVAYRKITVNSSFLYPATIILSDSFVYFLHELISVWFDGVSRT